MDSLSRLVAVEEIRTLKSRYFNYVDTRDWSNLRTLFCEDAVLDFAEALRYWPLSGEVAGPLGPIVSGGEAIVSWISSACESKTTLHHGHCHEITIENSDEAAGVIAMEDFIYEVDRKTLVLRGAGHHFNRYRREDGMWRISEIRLVRLFNFVEAGGAYDTDGGQPHPAMGLN